MHSKKLIKIFIFFTSLMALISISQGIINAQKYSIDFQWSPSVLLSEKINPFDYYLNGNENNRIILYQVPNYLHLVYVLLYPLTFFDWETTKTIWAILNILFSVFSVLIISKFSNLSKNQIIIIFLIFACSTPYRNTLGNGQQSLLVLLAFSFVLFHKNITTLITGIGYLKYSFAPPFVFYIFCKNGIKKLLLSFLFPVLGLLVFYYIQNNKDFIRVLIQPFLIGKDAVGIGHADLMSIVEIFRSQLPNILFLSFYYVIPFVISAIIAFYCSKQNFPLLELSILSTVSLLLFKHNGYDFVFLLPAFILSVKYISFFYSKIIFLGIFYFWFGLRIWKFYCDFSSIIYKEVPIFNFFILLLILIALIFLGYKLKYKEK